MYQPNSSFTVRGTAFGMDVKIKIAVAAANANAHPAITNEGNTSVTDVQNLQTIFVRAVHEALSSLQGMEIQRQNPFRAGPPLQPQAAVGNAGTAPSTPSKVANIADYRKPLRDEGVIPDAEPDPAI